MKKQLNDDYQNKVIIGDIYENLISDYKKKRTGVIGFLDKNLALCNDPLVSDDEKEHLDYMIEVLQEEIKSLTEQIDSLEEEFKQFNSI